MIRKDYKRAIDGGIIEIPLWGNFGFAYAKYIDGTKHPELGRLLFILKVFNYRSPTPIKDIHKLKSAQYLVDGILVAGLPPTITNQYWKVVGKDQISKSDLETLVFKKWSERYEKWLLIENGEREFTPNTNIDFDDYQEYSYKGTGNIEIELTLKFMHKEGVQPEQHLDFRDETVQAIYNRCKKNGS